MPGSLTIRPAVTGDLDLVRWALYTALAWDPEDPIPPFEAVVDHPKIAVYHAGWMRPGDAGVVAEVDGEAVGMAYCRLFPDGGDSQGFVDEETPELAVAVRAEHRDRGIGGRLITALFEMLAAAGVRRMSLSVSAGNPAERLYRRLGFRTEREEEGGDLVMVADL
ncbi:MAG: GNAT family N-acetyltransferase [Actinobacteria bacterium]|nr:GNAT family N-acetyltransferase [Actinomycetota bacterium]